MRDRPFFMERIIQNGRDAGEKTKKISFMFEYGRLQ